MTGTRRPNTVDDRGSELTRRRSSAIALAGAAPDAPARPSRWHVAEWPITIKIIAVLAIPAIIATIFGLVQVQSQLATAGRNAASVTQAGVLAPGWAVLSAADDMQVGGEMAEAAELGDAIDRLATAREEPSLSDAQRADIDDVITAAKQIEKAAGTASLTAVETIGTSLAAVAEKIPTSDEASTRALESYRELITARLALGEQRRTIAHPAAVAEVNTTQVAAQVGAESVALSRVTGEQDLEDNIAVVLDRTSSRLSQLSDAGLPTAASLSATAELYDSSATAAVTDITDTLSAAALQSRSQALLVTAPILGLILAGFAAALVVARSLTQSLQVVRRSTRQIAAEQLPRDVADVLEGRELSAMPKIPIRSEEEIGQLARAVESLYGRARELATAQAALRQQVSGMFETLSRRSNALVERQLTIVEKLERDEPDAQRLSELFELDHLAARMRRNGESLLVLAGAKGRAARAAQLSVADAARAATAEVADYQRVVLADIGNQVVVGAVSSDLIHLFAELIDNALSYSPPHSEVIVVGARTADGGMLVEIVDEGLGIEPEEREDLNKVLRTSTELTPESARRMGLFVVGRLAALHGIGVTLRPNPSGGTIAAVALPSEALVVASRANGYGERERTETVPVPAVAAPVAEAAEPVRLAPVADITSRPSTREGAPETAGRPALARRVRGENGPTPGANATAPEAAASAPALPSRTASAPALPSRTASAPALPSRTASAPALPQRPASAPALPSRPTFSPPTGTTSAAETAARRGAGAAAAAAAVSGSAAAVRDGKRADAETPEVETAGSATPTRPITTAEVDPSLGHYADTMDPRTIRTWVTAASAEPGDDDDTEDRRPAVGVATVSAGTGGPVEAPAEPAPVYNSTRSRWLTDTGSVALPWDDDAAEVVAGHEAAARAAAPVVEQTTEAGLPRRAPGAHLVPGAITTADLAARRLDPETVRESMNRHLAGVRRGRADAGSASDE